MGLLEMLLTALIYIVVIIIIGGLILWAIRTYGPAEAQEPSRLIIGGIMLLAILIVLLTVLVRGLPPLLILPSHA